jgi:hypothetical protein
MSFAQLESRGEVAAAPAASLRSGLPLHRCDRAEVIAHQQLVVRRESTTGGAFCRPFPAQISVKVAAGA